MNILLIFINDICSLPVENKKVENQLKNRNDFWFSFEKQKWTDARDFSKPEVSVCCWYFIFNKISSLPIDKNHQQNHLKNRKLIEFVDIFFSTGNQFSWFILSTKSPHFRLRKNQQKQFQNRNDFRFSNKLMSLIFSSTGSELISVIFFLKTGSHSYSSKYAVFSHYSPEIQIVSWNKNFIIT